MNFLKQVWEAWKKIAAKIAHVQGNILLGIIYLVIVAPIALFFRMAQDPLAIKRKKKTSYWVPRPPLGEVDKFLKREF